MATPDDRRYAKSHEWILLDGDEATIGITDHAQEALNDIVYVELPAVGARFEAGEGFGVVESVKSVSDLYLPATGTVTAINEALEDAPETINEDPYGKGWLIRVQVEDAGQVDGLLTASGYEDLIGS